MMFDYLVLGKGLIGAAAARYLSAAADGVASLGPDEPADLSTHPGAFGSHYDQGRVTRQLGADWVWSWLAQKAIAAYPELAAASGIPFHEAVGGLYVAGPEDPYLARVDDVADRLAVPYHRWSADELKRRHPYLHFPSHHKIVFEPAPAGYINPRDVIRAQLTVARRQGTTLINDTAVKVTDDGQTFTVTTVAGRTVRARRLLLATGAFTNAYNLLPRPLDLRLKTEHVLLVRLDQEQATVWGAMPTVIYQIEADALWDIYLLPPIRYPDGHIYIKLGANTRHDRELTGLADLRHWFQAGDSDVAAADLWAALSGILPDLRPDAQPWHTARCLVTYTRHRRPYLGPVLPDRLYLAVGGNGRAAKSADTIGRLAAAMILNQPWPQPMTPSLFRPHWSA